MWCCHELGERLPPQDAMVGAIEGHQLEDDPLSAEVCWCAEGDWQRHLADRVHLPTRDDAVEGGVGRLDHRLREPQSPERVQVEDFDGTATIHQCLGEKVVAYFGLDHQRD